MDEKKTLYVLKINNMPLEINKEVLGVERIEHIEILERAFKKITKAKVEIDKYSDVVKSVVTKP